MTKRRAHAKTTHIVIRCMPGELNNSHIPELKKVITETDAAYLKSHQNAERQKQIMEDKEKRFRDDLKDVADNLEL